MPKKLKKIPRFESEWQERAFWEAHDSADYVDSSGSERVGLSGVPAKRFWDAYQVFCKMADLPSLEITPEIWHKARETSPGREIEL